MTHGLRYFADRVAAILLAVAVLSAALGAAGAAPKIKPKAGTKARVKPKPGSGAKGRLRPRLGGAKARPGPRIGAAPLPAAIDLSASGSPYDAGPFTPAGQIDTLVLKTLRARKIPPANICSDAVFIRRAYLDVIGTLPEPMAIRYFLADRDRAKRSKLIERLLKRREFADYWAQRWGDLLRVKAEFPINLWPNGVQAYSRWIHDAVRDNMPYDRFARELLTSSGSNFRVPQVNFYRAIQGQEPSAIATAVGLTLMGARVDKWPAGRRAGMEAFFSRLAYKKTAEWKEEIVYPNPASVGALDAVFPDGKRVRIPPGKDPRAVFADWLITPENAWFTRNIANRVWTWLLGRGIIHEPDDIRPDNPPVHPAVLAYLEKELVSSNYDLRHIYRLILNSSTYQQSPVPRGEAASARALFACYPVRRLDAEVLIDALDWLSGSQESYSSAIPEPFTFVPEDRRTIELDDGSITSQFLEMFGRPPRDTGMYSERNSSSSQDQRLHMLNSADIQGKIDRSWRLRQLQKNVRGGPGQMVNMIYLTVLSRPPTPDERSAAEKYFLAKGVGTRNGSVDLTWALINTKEFLYRH